MEIEPTKEERLAKFWEYKNAKAAEKRAAKLARMKAWVANNHERHKASGRQWREANKEKRQAEGRLWYARHRDKVIARAKEWGVENVHKRRTTAFAGRLRRDRQMTVDQYYKMLSDQGGKCAICPADTPGGAGSWHVDHCHKTGLIRGLLCRACNMGLGVFNDDVPRLIAAAEYLRKFACEETS